MQGAKVVLLCFSMVYFGKIQLVEGPNGRVRSPKLSRGNYMSTRKIQISSCLLLGICGTVLGGLLGLLLLLQWGYFGYIRLASFAFSGAMLLFCATLQPGQGQKNLRGKLLLLFFTLLLSVFDLPLLSPLLVALVLPLFFLLYPVLFPRKQFYILLVVEVLQAVLRTVSIMDVFQGATEGVIGAALLAVCCFRGFFLVQGYRQSKSLPAATTPEPLHTLRK